MKIQDSYELLKYLKSQNLLPVLDKTHLESHCKDFWWWPNALSFEVVVGAILVQNTRWEQVSMALENLKLKHCLDLERLSMISLPNLQSLIQNVGFYNQKAIRIQKLCQNILEDFGDWENFAIKFLGNGFWDKRGLEQKLVMRFCAMV